MPKVTTDEVVTITSVRWYAGSLLFGPPDSIAIFLHLDLWSRQLTFKSPSTNFLSGVQFGSMKGSPQKEIGRQEERAVGVFVLCPQPARSSWLVGTSVEGLFQAANLLLFLRPRGARDSLLLLVLGHSTAPSWFVKPCQHLWKWSLYLTHWITKFGYAVCFLLVSCQK